MIKTIFAFIFTVSFGTILFAQSDDPWAQQRAYLENKAKIYKLKAEKETTADKIIDTNTGTSVLNPPSGNNGYNPCPGDMNPPAFDYNDPWYQLKLKGGGRRQGNAITDIFKNPITQQIVTGPITQQITSQPQKQQILGEIFGELLRQINQPKSSPIPNRP